MKAAPELLLRIRRSIAARVAHQGFRVSGWTLTEDRDRSRTRHTLLIKGTAVDAKRHPRDKRFGVVSVVDREFIGDQSYPMTLAHDVIAFLHAERVKKRSR
jgi:hypothetical protein